MTAHTHEITICISFTREETQLLTQDSGWNMNLKRKFEASNYPYAHVFDCDDIVLYLDNRITIVGDLYRAYFTFDASHISSTLIEDMVDEYLEELRAK